MLKRHRNCLLCLLSLHYFSLPLIFLFSSLLFAPLSCLCYPLFLIFLPLSLSPFPSFTLHLFSTSIHPSLPESLYPSPSSLFTVVLLSGSACEGSDPQSVHGICASNYDLPLLGAGCPQVSYAYAGYHCQVRHEMLDTFLSQTKQVLRSVFWWKPLAVKVNRCEFSWELLNKTKWYVIQVTIPN